MKNNKRINWIDIAKGIGIILVILGHAPRDIMREEYTFINYIYHFIYSFHMPLFFMLSGYVYTKMKYKYTKDSKFILNKFQKLIMPWIIYSILIYLIILVLNKINIFDKYIVGTELEVINFLKYLKFSILYTNPYAFHLWFLLVLFVIQIMFYYMEKIFKNKKLLLKIIYFALIVLLGIIYALTKIKIVLIRYAIRGSIYYLLGINMADMIENSDKFNIKNIALVIIGFLITNVYIICVCFKQIDITYIKSIIYLVEILIGSPIMIYFVILISKNINKNTCLEYLGRNSFTIYLLHQPFFCAFIGTLLVKTLNSSLTIYLMIMSICTIMSICGPIIITKILYKFRLGEPLTKIGIKKM